MSKANFSPSFSTVWRCPATGVLAKQLYKLLQCILSQAMDSDVGQMSGNRKEITFPDVRASEFGVYSADDGRLDD